tara:strand:- start:78 stop:770 length:693 start_codon:yes stop_codon:yes gene_type:complete
MQSPTDICEHLVDAQQMHVENPASFEVPDAAKLARPQAGWTAKICDHEQRFWTEVVSADDAFITAKVDNHTGCEDRGYGIDQLIKYERRHVYILNTPKEQAQHTLHSLISMGRLPQPTPQQQELRAMYTYVPKHWAKHRDPFGQGVRKAHKALSQPADHAKILAHFCATPGLLEAAGLDANDIGIAHVQSHQEIAANVGDSPDSEAVDAAYHRLANLGVQRKLVCLAFND